MKETIAILMATYQGEQYLPRQLLSIEQQTCSSWQLHASDDGSTDGSRSVLSGFRERVGRQRVFLHAGPQRGFAANFLQLVCHPDIVADYYAYSDQDDIWEPDKLEAALFSLRSVPADTPALHCGRTLIIDELGNGTRLSPCYFRPPVFANALVQNIAGGNTMVFNKAARDRLAIAGPAIVVPAHDWWTYLAITACGGVVLYDPVPRVRYRQHPGNLIGGARRRYTWPARAKGWLTGQFSGWMDQNIAALQHLIPYLTKDNIRILDVFAGIRQAGTPWGRLLRFKQSGVYRQTVFGNVVLELAAVLGLI